MRTTTSILILSAIALPFSMAAAAKSMKLKNLPPAVRATVEEQSKGFQMKGVSKEVENGKTTYELETVANGKTRDLIIGEDGKVLIVEQEVTLESIPALAKAALEKSAEGGKITKVETITKDNVVTYEGIIRRGKKDSEVVVDAQGVVQK